MWDMSTSPWPMQDSCFPGHQPMLRPRRHHASSRRRHALPVVESLEGAALLALAATSVAVSVSSQVLSYDQAGTLSATVSALGGAAIPNGETVTFSSGGTTLGSVPWLTGSRRCPRRLSPRDRTRSRPPTAATPTSCPAPQISTRPAPGTSYRPSVFPITSAGGGRDGKRLHHRLVQQSRAGR